MLLPSVISNTCNVSIIPGWYVNLSLSICVNTVSKCINALELGILKASIVSKVLSLSLNIFLAINSILSACVLCEIPIAITWSLNIRISPPSIWLSLYLS